MSNKKEPCYCGQEDLTVERVIGYCKGNSKVKLNHPIVIPKGVELESGIKQIIFQEETYELVIGIGNDYAATLVIGADALEALNSIGEEVNCG